MNDSQNKSTPKTIKPLRVLAETFIIFLIVNIVFALINPPASSLLLFNRALPGFQRFPILQAAKVGANGLVRFSTEVVANLDVLFPSHFISGKGKSNDEYRVILIGDSSARGAGLPIEQTLTGQINQADLTSCDNRQIVVYNLGYPGTAIKDLMILSEAIKNYHPDLIIWTFSMYAFREQQNQDITSSNLGRIRALEQTTDYRFLKNKDLPKESTFIDRTIYGQRGDLNLLLRLSLLDINYISIGTDEPRMMNNNTNIQKKTVGEQDGYGGLKTGDNIMDILDIRLLLAANKISGTVPILYVNEPIYIKKDNPVRYNGAYPHWAYDQYRDILRNLSNEQSWTYLDLWDLLPQNQFSNSVFHRTANGEARLAQELIPTIQIEACRK